MNNAETAPVIAPPPPPKKKWWEKLLDAVGEAIGQAKFGE